MAKILREFINLQYDKKKILELKEAKQPILVTSILQRADAVNQNKRVYPRAVLDREVENYKKAVAESRATGELDHPDSSIISLSKVSHVIREIWWEGNDVFGRLEILNTPMGEIAQRLMESGIQLGISSRGVGETRKTNEGFDEVDESFMLIGFDLVSEPSTNGAWLMREGKEVDATDIKNLINKADRINRVANEILRSK